MKPTSPPLYRRKLAACRPSIEPRNFPILNASIDTAGAEPTAAVNVPAPAIAVAGFQVAITGRFWMSTEAY
jgi:hypothetical protein